MEEKRPGVDEAAYQRADVERLDPEGDVMLTVDDGAAVRDLLVSSKILSLASPAFKSLFAPIFSEGKKLAELGYTEVSLHDDNPAAMRTMLAILHYQDASELNGADPEAIATLAICCDKYDCVKPIRPWVETWFHHRPSISTAEDYGFTLLAAHLFRSSEHFSRISTEIIKDLSPGFSAAWEANDILAFLPSTVRDDLTEEQKKLLLSMHHQMQSVELSLRKEQKGYFMTGKVCVSCGRTLQDSAKRCNPCNNNDLYLKICNSDSRIAEYFAALRKAELWPSVKPFETCSPSELASRIVCAKSDSCNCSSSCPLQRELERLDNWIRYILKNLKGFPLYSLR